MTPAAIAVIRRFAAGESTLEDERFLRGMADAMLAGTKAEEYLRLPPDWAERLRAGERVEVMAASPSGRAEVREQFAELRRYAPRWTSDRRNKVPSRADDGGNFRLMKLLGGELPPNAEALRQRILRARTKT